MPGDLTCPATDAFFNTMRLSGVGTGLYHETLSHGGGTRHRDPNELNLFTSVVSLPLLNLPT